jgi:hypothetical protein
MDENEVIKRRHHSTCNCVDTEIKTDAGVNSPSLQQVADAEKRTSIADIKVGNAISCFWNRLGWQSTYSAEAAIVQHGRTQPGCVSFLIWQLWTPFSFLSSLI